MIATLAHHQSDGYKSEIQENLGRSGHKHVANDGPPDCRLYSRVGVIRAAKTEISRRYRGGGILTAVGKADATTVAVAILYGVS